MTFRTLSVIQSDMKETLVEAHAVARFTDVPVLLLGPRGVGKTRLAKVIHKLSGVKGKEPVTVDCGTLRDEASIAGLWGWEKGSFTGAVDKKTPLIAEAQDGTFFLDEIGNADLFTQQNLLRLLQNRRYRPRGSNVELDANTRIIAATNSNLREEIRQNRFRQDLFDRLSVYVIEVPPLRERPEDIVPFAREFLRQFNSKSGAEIEKLGGTRKVLSAGAERELHRHDWPGNVRELESTITRLAIRTISPAEEIAPEDVKRELALGTTSSATSVGMEPMGDAFDLETVLDRVRFHYLQQAMSKSGGNKTEMARLLGYNSRTPLKTVLDRLREAGYPIDK